MALLSLQLWSILLHILRQLLRRLTGPYLTMKSHLSPSAARKDLSHLKTERPHEL